MVSPSLPGNVSTPVQKPRPSDAAYLLVHADSLTNRVLQRLRHTDLVHFAGMALHQIQRPVPFTVCAPASGFAALAGAFGERAVQKAFAGGELSETGTEPALGSGM